MGQFLEALQLEPRLAGLSHLTSPSVPTCKSIPLSGCTKCGISRSTETRGRYDRGSFWACSKCKARKGNK